MARPGWITDIIADDGAVTVSTWPVDGVYRTVVLGGDYDGVHQDYATAAAAKAGHDAWVDIASAAPVEAEAVPV